jgi:hypothetical protein
MTTVENNQQVLTPEDFEIGPPPPGCPTCNRWRAVLLESADGDCVREAVCIGCRLAVAICTCQALAEVYQIRLARAA